VAQPLRHPLIVRATHWITALCFLALLVSGVEILISHPRFYWGETGNALTPPLFIIPVPASRASVPTGYGLVLPDQNGWSRYLHFQTAWLAVLTGLLYLATGLLTRHFQRNLLPSGNELSAFSLSRTIADHIAMKHSDSYNVLQKLACLSVVFVAFPLVIWTGLAMSPAIASVFPWAVSPQTDRHRSRSRRRNRRKERTDSARQRWHLRPRRNAHLRLPPPPDRRLHGPRVPTQRDLKDALSQRKATTGRGI